MTAVDLAAELRTDLSVIVSDGRRGRDVDPAVRRILDRIRDEVGQPGGTFERLARTTVLSDASEVLELVLAGRFDDADRALGSDTGYLG
jgi:hypothetical protein